MPFNKNGRPVYYCIKDKKYCNIFWVVPMTTKIDKVDKAIKKLGGEDKCKIYCKFPAKNKSAFNIGDIFPITEKYIEREYQKNGKHYILKDVNLINKIRKKAYKIINYKMTTKIQKGININEIHKKLIDELK